MKLIHIETGEEVNLSQEDRIKHLSILLLLSQDYETTEGISEKLSVAQNTVIKDLEVVEKIFNENKINLLKKGGYGIKIIAEQSDKRYILESIIQNKLTEYDIYLIMKILLSSGDHHCIDSEGIQLSLDAEFNGIYNNVLKATADIIFNNNVQHIDYSEILSLTIRVSLSIYYLLKGYSIGSYKMLTEEFSESFKNEFSYLIVKKILPQYDLPIFEDEFQYVFSDMSEKYNKFNIKKMVKDLVVCVGRELDYPFEYDPILYNNLFAHISLRLSKKRYYYNEYNPYTDDIKKNYSDIFFAIKKYYIEIFEEKDFILNESFVSYLVMHFSVSLEKHREKEEINIMYVCSTGLGVTNLLEQKIKKEIQGVGQIYFSSILNLNNEIEKYNPDFIISIFPLEIDTISWLKVNSIPTSNDLTMIQNKINELLVMNVTNKFSGNKSNEISNNEVDKYSKSESIILKGYSVFQEMKNDVQQEYQDTFLLHVLLMTNRIYNKSQYINEFVGDDEIIKQNKNVVIKIEKIFSNNNLAINKSEVVALLQYLI